MKLAGGVITADQSGGPFVPAISASPTVVFCEDIHGSKVAATDFGNAGTAATAIGPVTEILPGTFTAQTTPTNAGSLQSTVTADVLKDFAANKLTIKLNLAAAWKFPMVPILQLRSNPFLAVI